MKKKYLNNKLIAIIIIFILIIMVFYAVFFTSNNQEDSSFSILFLGDFMIGDAYTGPPNVPFENLKSMFENKEDIIVNVETSITDRSTVANPNKDYSYKINESIVKELMNNNINIFNLANNHLLDYGQDGFNDTIEIIEKNNLLYFGAGFNNTQARSGIIRIYPDTTKVGYLGYFEYRESYDTNYHFYAIEDASGVAELNNTNLEEDIPKLKQEADIVIVSLHIGGNYITSIYTGTIEFAHYAIDLGADAVIIHSPHIPLPVELYEGKPIFYSIGNFIFTTIGGFYRVDEEYHAGLGVEFIIKNKKINTVKIHPFKANNREIAYHPSFLNHDEAIALYNKIITQGIDAKIKGSTCIFTL